MARMFSTDMDIEKEADRTIAIASSVVDALPKIINGTLKLSQSPEFCNLTLSYALYGKIVDTLENQTNLLPIILKFLFPDLAQFLPPSIFTLTSEVRSFINEATRLGHRRSLYQPVSKIYSDKSSLEDFKKWGISRDMLVTGRLVSSSGSQMQLKNRHVILLLNLRNKNHLCWFKIVPQWLRFFRILQADDCVPLQNIKVHWVGLSEQADNLKGAQLREFLDTPFTLPESFIRKNIDPVTSPINHTPGIGEKRYISVDLKEDQGRIESLQKEVDELRSEVTRKNKEISAYQKQFSQKESELEHLATRLCKTRLVKNHWLMKYRSMSGINHIADDFEFNADLSYAQKICDGARYIKGILQLRYSDQRSRFVENFLDDSFIEELLKSILAQGNSFGKSSNILSEILQDLVNHSQRKFRDNLEWKDSKTSDGDTLLKRKKLVARKTNSTATEDVLVISDSDESASHQKTGPTDELIDLCDENDCENLSKAKNTHGQALNSSGSIQNEYSRSRHEEMLQEAYISYKMAAHKSTGHVSQEDAISYQPKTKMIRLERQKPSPVVNSDANADHSSDASLSPLLLDDEPCPTPFILKESYIQDISKHSENDQNSFSLTKMNSNEKDSCKPQNDQWMLSHDENVREVSFENTTRLDSPPCLILENPDYQTLDKQISPEKYLIDSPPCLMVENSDLLQTLDEDKQVCPEKNPNPKINPAPTELTQDKTQSPSNVFDDFTNTEKKGKGKKKRKNIAKLDKRLSQ